MRSAEGKSRSAQLWIGRAERGPALTMDHSSGLRDRVQHVISDAEESKDFKKKKNQFLGHLRDFDARPDAHVYGDF